MKANLNLPNTSDSQNKSSAGDHRLLLAEIRVPRLVATLGQQMQDGGVISLNMKSREIKDILMNI